MRRPRANPRPVATGAGAEKTDLRKRVDPYITPTGFRRKDEPPPRGLATLAEAARQAWAFAVLLPDCPPLVVLRAGPSDNFERALDFIVEDNMPLPAFVDSPRGLRERRKVFRVY